MKHNKKRNTAFIYETLTREFTKAIIDKDAARKTQIRDLLKEYFSKGKILATELELYATLLETVSVPPRIAERLLQETKLAYSALEERTIFETQSKIISAVNKGLGQDVWGNFVPNFKSLASVNAIFNTKVGIKKRVLFEQMIVDRMSTAPTAHAVNNLKSLDNLTYNSFIQKFNDKYSNLLSEQKDLLNRYITSFADEGFELRLYLNEELGRLKEALAKPPEQTAPVLTSKIEEVRGYLEEFRKREFTDTDLGKILQTQELVQELSIQ